jgi:hypothetical protein
LLTRLRVWPATRLYHFFISPFTIFFARIADAPRFVAFKDLSGRLLKTRQDLAPQDASILQDESQELAHQPARQDPSGILLKTQDLKTRVKKGSRFKTCVKTSRLGPLDILRPQWETAQDSRRASRFRASRPQYLKASRCAPRPRARGNSRPQWRTVEDALHDSGLFQLVRV